jgi:hypothetical protein
MKIAVFLYELSGKTAEPFAQAGWDCYCIDIAHERNWSDGSVHYIKADARAWKPTREIVENIKFFAAMPPCDDLAVSGARWFKGKGLRKLSQAIELFAVATEWAEFFGVPYFIENPRSTISTYWRKPDHSFHPWQYTDWEMSDNYTKTTCLWTGGGFIMPARNEMPDCVDDRIHKAAPGPGRANFRSQSPLGFIRAVYAANFPSIQQTQRN